MILDEQGSKQMNTDFNFTLTKCPNCKGPFDSVNVVPLDGSYWVKLATCGCLDYEGEWAREALAAIKIDDTKEMV